MLPFDPALLIVPVVFVVILTLTLAKRKTGQAEYPYVAAPGLFTPAERRFLRALEQALPEYRVFAKVRVADFVRVQKGLSRRSWRSAFNRIAMKHADFVLCRPRDLSVVVCVVELDDKTHERKSRQARDVFLENTLAAAGVPLVRVRVAPKYDVAELRDLFGGLEAKAA